MCGWRRVLTGVCEQGLGVYLILFGFRLFKVTSGLVGFMFGFFFLFFLLMYVLADATPNRVWIAMGSGLGLGVMLFLLLFFVPILALIVLSAFVGVVFGIILYEIALVYTNWPPAYYVSMAVSAVLFLILGLIIKKFFIVFMTSLYGSFAICYGEHCCLLNSACAQFFFFTGVATFAGGFPIFVDTSAVGYVRPPNYWLVYIYFAGIIVGTILGCILQYCVFARGLAWEDVRGSCCPSARKSRASRRTKDDLGVPLMDDRPKVTDKRKKKEKSSATKGKY